MTYLFFGGWHKPLIISCLLKRFVYKEMALNGFDVKEVEKSFFQHSLELNKDSQVYGSKVIFI